MLYLVDKPMAEIAFRTAATDSSAEIVLIQDGVLLEPEFDGPMYAVEKDVTTRGVDLADEIESITYERLTELVFEQEVRSFV